MMWKVLLLFIFLLVLSVFLQVLIDIERIPTGPVFEAPERLLGEVLGGLRITLADLLWVRIDKYFHAYEPIEESHLHHEKEEYEQFAKVTDVMPLIRLITWLDSHFVEAYQIGGWHLAFNLGKLDEAEKFFREGLRFNPERYEMYAELGKLYLQKKSQLLKASTYLKEALNHPILELSERKALYILLAVSYERLGNFPESLKSWYKASEINPDDVIIRERIEALNKMGIL